MPYTFIAGVLFGALFVKSALRLVLRSLSRRSSSNSVYGLDHAKLNLELPPRNMWMNMGYWTDPDNETFATACPALLRRVLSTAGLLAAPTEDDPRTPIRVLDIGIGCGDQSRWILGRGRELGEEASPGDEPPSASSLPPLENYVGITENAAQHAYAVAAVAAAGQDPCGLFCADGSDPSDWSYDIRKAIDRRLHGVESPERYEARDWVIGLDSLYHLKPSRRKLYCFAHDRLRANIAAFDLLLPDEKEQTLSWGQELLLGIVCWTTGTPRRNLLTPVEYRAMLVEAGYDNGQIQIDDISSHVFLPLTGFLAKHHLKLGLVGLGLGPFRAAMWVFGWWGRSGVVRGCIVVAKHRE